MRNWAESAMLVPLAATLAIAAQTRAQHPSARLEVPAGAGGARAAIVQRSLGSCAGDARYAPRADLDGDGCVTVLDVLLLRHSDTWGASGRARGGVAGLGEVIVVEPSALTLNAGEVGSVLFKLQQNTTPLFGYSIDVDFVPLAGSEDSINAEIEPTNFYHVQNLIVAGGASLDPIFSVILDSGDGGVFVSANTADGSAVQAADDVNDVLAQVFFRACPNASGDFNVVLGPASALSDGNGFAVPFGFAPATIIVLPGVPADLDGDCRVEHKDLTGLLDSWGPCPDLCRSSCPADLDGDCTVGVVDFLALLENWTID